MSISVAKCSLKLPIFSSFKSKWCKSKGLSVKVREMFPSRVQIEKTPTALIEVKVNKITSFTMLFQFFLAFLTAALNDL